MNPDDLNATVAAMRQQGADDEAVHRFLTEHAGLQEVAGPRPDGKPRGFRTPEQIARLNKADVEGAADEMAADEATTRGKVLGTFAAPLGEVPGGKALEGYAAGGAARGMQGIREGAEDVKDAISSAPAAARIPAKILGGVASTALVPGGWGIGAQGAALGGAGEALNPDDLSIGERLGGAALGAGVGGALGILGDLALTGGRSIGATPLGRNALDRRAAMSAADKIGYGAAEREGAEAVRAERGAKADAQQAIRRTNEIVNRKALPAPGQSEVAKADVGLQRDPTGVRNVELPPTLETAAKDNYTNVLPEQAPAADLPHGGGQFQIEDYTKPRPVKLQGTNDKAVQLPPRTQAPETHAPLPNPLSSVRRALQEPDIAPYVKEIMGSRSLAGADEPTILREVYKLMSERQGNIKRVAMDADNFKAGTALEGRDIGAMKGVLADAADDVMPSFRSANATHAKHAGELDALREGADATKRLVRGKSVAGKNLEKKSPEGFLKRLGEMEPGEQQAAREGVLGRTKDQLHLTPNPLSGFGTLTSAYRVGKATPMLRATDNAAGRSTFLNALRALIAGGSGEIAGP